MADYFKELRLENDPIIGDILNGKKSMPLVGDELFITSSVTARDGKIGITDAEDYIYISGKQDTRAEEEEISMEIVPFNFSLDDFKYGARVYDQEIEERNRAIDRMSGSEIKSLYYDLSEAHIYKMERKALIEKEYLRSVLATTVTNYPGGAAGDYVHQPAVRWDNAAVDIRAEFETVKDMVLANVGIFPNTVLMAQNVYSALKANADIIDAFKYTTPGITDAEKLAQYIGVDRVIIGAASYKTDLYASRTYFWDDCAIFFYRPTEQGTISGEPYFGITFQNDGYPRVKPWRRDPDENHWTYYDCYVNALMNEPGGVLVDTILT